MFNKYFMGKLRFEVLTRNEALNDWIDELMALLTWRSSAGRLNLIVDVSECRMEMQKVITPLPIFFRIEGLEFLPPGPFLLFSGNCVVDQWSILNFIYASLLLFHYVLHLSYHHSIIQATAVAREWWIRPMIMTRGRR